MQASKPRKIQSIYLLIGILFALTSCDSADNNQKPAVSAEEAKLFIKESEQRIKDASLKMARAAWIFANFITHDSQQLNIEADKEYTALQTELAIKAKQYIHLDLSANDRRKLTLLISDMSLPAPSNSHKISELAKLKSNLKSRYGKGLYCKKDTNKKEHCLNLEEMTLIMANSQNPEELLDIWKGWRTVSPPMRTDYQQLVEIANEGAQNLGYQDVGELWRSKYDMPADAFAQDYDFQWEKVKPLYKALHCHVRAKLGEQYGQSIVPQDKAIPAHLLGNMWAQQWSNIYKLAAPRNADPGYDLTKQIQASAMTEIDMFKTAESFFTSLGFEALPNTFWERSLFTKPKDRDVVCHASAWNLDSQDDIRVKMCTKKTGDDFRTIHHELGHNFYQRAYKHQDTLFQGSANEGFHEAIGDTISLSITPRYLVDIGLLDKEPDPSKDIGILLHQALLKIAFLPFALIIDKWRWQIFSGDIKPDQYNASWWALREQYQGIRAPVARSEADFDPGAKYHVPANVSYARYFLAYIQQFQFHQALCKTAGYAGPLHRCTIYNNKAAGKKLAALLEMGKSHPWPEAMHTITGQSELDASAIINYFAPLKTWLDEQNKNRQCGW